LAADFQSGVNEDAATECPGGIQSPTSWHMDATPDVPAGSILCGTYNNAPDFMWTKTDGLLLADIQGPDLDTLYAYWISL
jgi:serine/threonine kinase PknH